jgi:hypothetical protein
MEIVRGNARTVARDLIRLVRALELQGMRVDDLDADDTLASVNRELAAILAKPPSADTAEAVARCAAATASVRAAILDALPRPERVALLEALLQVEVTEADLDVETLMAEAAEVAEVRARDELRRAERQRGEALRRRAERMPVSADDTIRELLGRLPRPWLTAIWNNAGFRGRPSATAAARTLLDPGTLRALVEELRPAEHSALRALLRAGGVVRAGALEAFFGDSSEDGYEWHVAPPTSVLGRLRARGLVAIGRAALTANPRSRPRVVVVPRDLRRPLARALAAPRPVLPTGPTVPADVVTGVMAEPPPDRPIQAEAEGQGFDRAQPELAAWTARLAEHMSDEVGPGPLFHFVSRVWHCYETAHPQLVPRLRARELETARVAAVADLDAAWVMHERLLERRVARMVARQPHLYGYVSGALDHGPWSDPRFEKEKLLIFHACDVAMRAFDAALLDVTPALPASPE